MAVLEDKLRHHQSNQTLSSGNHECLYKISRDFRYFSLDKLTDIATLLVWLKIQKQHMKTETGTFGFGGES